MENKFNFNSAICTSREQSEKLLKLGLKQETADMWWQAVVADSRGKPIPKKGIVWFKSFHATTQMVGLSRVEFIPAWSLSRLLCMLPDRVYEEKYWHDGRTYDNILEPEIDFWGGLRYKGTEGNYEFYDNSNLYESVVQCIEWLINEGYFNKDFLNETKTNTKED